MPFWVIQDSISPSPPTDVPNADWNNISAGIITVEGPFDDRDAAEAVAIQRRVHNPNEPWTVVRVVDAATRTDAEQQRWPDILEARRLAWGMSMRASERDRKVIGSSARQPSPTHETEQLIAALESRGIAITVTEPRLQVRGEHVRTLRIGVVDIINLIEYEHEASARAGVAHLVSQRSALPSAAKTQLHLYQHRRLVVLYGGDRPQILAVLTQVLGAPQD